MTKEVNGMCIYGNLIQEGEQLPGIGRQTEIIGRSNGLVHALELHSMNSKPIGISLTTWNETGKERNLVKGVFFTMKEARRFSQVLADLL